VSKFTAAYVTTNGKEWDQPLCVEISQNKCKEVFCNWYENVDYNDLSVRYAPVTIIECKQ